jgi:hypothetical protein
VKLGIDLDTERVAPGAEVGGSVVVVEGGKARSLTLAVGFFERSPAFRIAAFQDRVVIHEGELATGQEVPFHYALPDSAPPSVEGRHTELYWELEAVADEPGLDARVTRRFEVAR